MAVVYSQTFRAILENPAIIFFFTLLALFDVMALISLYLAPSKPFSLVLAPIIRTFWDERFLHYPDNFLLLPKLFAHAHFVILSIFGIFVSGIAIKTVEAHEEGNKVSAISLLGGVLKKYFSLLFAWLISYGLFVFLAERLLKLLPSAIALQLTVGFFTSLILQATFSFLLPAILIAGRGFFKDFWGGLVFGIKNLGFTSLLVAFPILVIVLFSFIKALSPFYTRAYPEAILWILGFGILVSLIVDLTVTVATTVYYVKVRNKKI